MGVKIDEDMILYTLFFADDQVVMAQEKIDVEYMARKLAEEYAKWGLNINFEKSSYLCVGGDEGNLELEEGKEIKACSKYKYLGFNIVREGTTSEEVGCRIAQGRKLIGALNPLLWSKQIKRETKVQIYNTMVKSVVTYAADVWTLSMREKQKLHSLEMDYLRRSARISRLDRVRNKDIRDKMGVTETILDHIQTKQLSWYGHVQRMAPERIPRKIFNWIPPERRRRGRPRKSWSGEMDLVLEERGLQENDWEDRNYWRLETGRRDTL